MPYQIWEVNNIEAQSGNNNIYSWKREEFQKKNTYHTYVNQVSYVDKEDPNYFTKCGELEKF